MKPELVARFYDDDLFQVTTRNSSSVMSATRPSTCSVCGPCCTAFLPESGCVRPASPLWPDVAPAQGNCSAPSSGRNLLNYSSSLTKIQRDKDFNVKLSIAGTTTKTQMKKRMRRSLKRRSQRRRKRMKKRMNTKPWGTAVSISKRKLTKPYRKRLSVTFFAFVKH